MNDKAPDYIPMSQCIKGQLYKIWSRNLDYGVYDGNGGFIGIRTKFGGRFLFTEDHYDKGAPFGTVYGHQSLGISVPEGITVAEYIEPSTVDHITKRPICFDKPLDQQGRGWYYLDTNEQCPFKDGQQDVCPVTNSNKALFDFIDEATRYRDEECH